MRSACAVGALWLASARGWTTLSQTRYGAQIADVQALQHGTFPDAVAEPKPHPAEMYYRVHLPRHAAPCRAAAPRHAAPCRAAAPRRRATLPVLRRAATRRAATRRDATYHAAPQRDATRRDATRRDATRRDATRRDATRRTLMHRTTTLGIFPPHRRLPCDVVAYA
jgi:hypothetical protein